MMMYTETATKGTQKQTKLNKTQMNTLSTDGHVIWSFPCTQTQLHCRESFFFFFFKAPLQNISLPSREAKTYLRLKPKWKVFRYKK